MGVGRTKEDGPETLFLLGESGREAGCPNNTNQTDKESGENVYAVAEPPLGGKVRAPPDGSVLFTEGETTYYQFDNVFLTQQQGKYVIVEEPKEVG